MSAALIPPFAHEDILLPDGSESFAWEGGLFHQVTQPFFEAHEMNLQDKAHLTAKLQQTSYLPKKHFPDYTHRQDPNFKE